MLVEVFEASVKGFECLMIGTEPRVIGVCSVLGNECGMDIEETIESVEL